MSSAYHGVTFLVVQNTPQVDENGNSNASNGKNTVNLGTPSAGHEYTGEGQPDPPLR